MFSLHKKNRDIALEVSKESGLWRELYSDVVEIGILEVVGIQK
jgi:hypothetical protein